MRNKYETPDIEIVKFAFKTNVLAVSDDPENDIVDNPDKPKPEIDPDDPFAGL